MANNNDEWVDVPLEAEQDEWVDVPMEQESVPMGGEMGRSLADVAAAEESIPDPNISKMDTALQHGTQGMAFGFGDELSGVFEAGGRALGLEGVGGPITDIGIADEPAWSKEKLLEAYREGRAAQRQRLAETEEAHPKTAIAADIAGGLATPGGVLKVAGKVPGIAKGISKVDKLSKVKKGMAAGGVIGAVEGAGRSEADLTEGETGEFMGDILAGTGLGAGLGGIAGKVSQKFEAGRIVKKADELLEEADESALRAMGASKKELKAATKSRLATDNPKHAGIQAIEDGLISPLDKPMVVYKKALEQKKEIGKGYQNLLNRFEGKIRLDETMDDAPGFAKKYTEEVRQKVMNSIDENVDITEQQAANLMKQVDNIEPRILEALDSSNPVKELQNLYVKYNKHFFNSSKNQSPATEAGGIMRQSIKDIQRRLVDKVDETGQESAKMFKQLDKRYSNILDLEEIALDATTKNPKIGFGDFIAGATAKLTGIPGAGEVVTGASIASKKVLKTDLQDVVDKAATLRKYKKAQKLKKIAEDPGKVRTTISESPGRFGAVSATTAGAVADQKNKPYQTQQAMAKAAEKASPQEIQQEAQNIREEYGEQGEQLAMKLDKMSEKDRTGRRATMFDILQNYQYRKMLENQKKED